MTRSLGGQQNVGGRLGTPLVPTRLVHPLRIETLEQAARKVRDASGVIALLLYAFYLPLFRLSSVGEAG